LTEKEKTMKKKGKLSLVTTRIRTPKVSYGEPAPITLRHLYIS